jgi:hypothetical protein
MSEISFSCGYCGAPCDQFGKQLDIPTGYDPNAYRHDVCVPCGNDQREPQRMRVTHEMAMDAQDPSLEGQEY